LSVAGSDAARVVVGPTSGAPDASQATYETPSKRATAKRPIAHLDPLEDLPVKSPPLDYTPEDHTSKCEISQTGENYYLVRAPPCCWRDQARG